jgi:hypothetical protein
LRNPLEPIDEKIRIEVRSIGDREIKVFRKSVGLKKALFETSAAFEDPGRRKNLVLENSSEHPTEHVVLFDNVRTKSEVTCNADNFLAADHQRFAA